MGDEVVNMKDPRFVCLLTPAEFNAHFDPAGQDPKVAIANYKIIAAKAGIDLELFETWDGVLYQPGQPTKNWYPVMPIEKFPTGGISVWHFDLNADGDPYKDADGNWVMIEQRISKATAYRICYFPDATVVDANRDKYPIGESPMPDRFPAPDEYYKASWMPGAAGGIRQG